jgi:hypothetical protein
MGVLGTTLGLRPGCHASIQLVWPEHVSGGVASFAVFVELRRGRKPTLTIQSSLGIGRGLTCQVLDIVEAQPNTPLRWYLVCPLSGRHCDALFLRDGVFASAKAQRLIYRSQRQRAKRQTHVAVPA